jgi:hypothetical protein
MVLFSRQLEANSAGQVLDDLGVDTGAITTLLHSAA